MIQLMGFIREADGLQLYSTWSAQLRNDEPSVAVTFLGKLPWLDTHWPAPSQTCPTIFINSQKWTNMLAQVCSTSSQLFGRWCSGQVGWVASVCPRRPLMTQRSWSQLGYLPLCHLAHSRADQPAACVLTKQNQMCPLVWGSIFRWNELHTVSFKNMHLCPHLHQGCFYCLWGEQ